MEIMKETPWSRIQGQNSVYKEFLEIVGNGNPTGSVWKETIAVSATIWIRVEKLHHQIRLRILSCGRVSENHREPEVPEAEVPAEERLDGFARITSKEHAIIHFVKNGTLQNACSTKRGVVVCLGKSAHSHIVKLMNNRQKRLKRIMTKSAVAMLKNGNWQKKEPVTDQYHGRPGTPGKRSDKKLWQNSFKRQFLDARQLGCVLQDMKRLMSIFRKGTDMPKPIEGVKFTKAIARHTKIRDKNPLLG